MRKIITLIVFYFLFHSLYAQLSFNLTGSTTQIDSSCFELTSDKTWQVGTAWFLNILDLNTDFTIEFAGYWGNKDATGADGMALIFSTQSKIAGGSGVGIGYSGISPSICVEFDTYYNAGNTDPTYDHIALQLNGNATHNATYTLSGPVQASATNADIEDGSWHIVKVTWSHKTNTLSVFFDCMLRTSYSGDIINTIFSGTSTIYWGFTSATGSLSNLHQVCFNYISFVDDLKDTSICKGNSVQLNTRLGSSYSWTPSTYLTNSSIQNPIAIPDTTTTYHVFITDACGNIQEDSITITVIQPIDILLPPDTSLCTGDSIILSALITGSDTNSISYQWGNNLGTSHSISVSPTISTTYEIIATDQCSSDSATSIIYVHSIPAINIISPPSTCSATATSISASGAISYQWDANTISDSIIIYPTADTTITVLAIDSNGCTTNSSASILVNALPSLSITGVDTICIGNSTMLMVTGASSYSWSNGSVTDSITVSPSSNTTYFVTGVDKNGCLGTTFMPVIVNATVQASISGNVIICQGDSILLTASGGNSYLWGNGDTLTSISLQPLSDTSCSVTVFDTNGCNDHTSIDIKVHPLPQLTILGKTEMCIGDSTILTATGGVSYSWSTGDTTNQIAVNSITNDSIRVIATDVNGCMNTSKIDIIVHSLPNISINANNAICEGEPTILSASGGLVYSWCTGENTSVVNVSPQSDTSYFVSAIDSFNCQNSDTIYLSVFPKPVVTLNGDSILCYGENTIVTAVGGSFYQWDNGDLQNSTVYSPLESTTITVIVSDSNNCSTLKSINLTVLPLPEPELGESFMLCSDETATIHAGDFKGYAWQDSSTEAAYTIMEPGIYKVEVIDEFGCKALDSISVIAGNCSSIYIPNTFSPNGDGSNDYFNAVGENISSYRIDIFDRWGNPIYTSAQINSNGHEQKGWNGNEAAIDCYIWNISYHGVFHNRTFYGSKKGIVNLIR